MVLDLSKSTNIFCSNGHKYDIHMDLNGSFNNPMTRSLSVDLDVHSAPILLTFFSFEKCAVLFSVLWLGDQNSEHQSVVRCV